MGVKRVTYFSLGPEVHKMGKKKQLFLTQESVRFQLEFINEGIV